MAGKRPAVRLEVLSGDHAVGHAEGMLSLGRKPGIPTDLGRQSFRTAQIFFPGSDDLSGGQQSNRWLGHTILGGFGR